MGIAKITRNNQVTITSDMTQLSGLKEGDLVTEEFVNGVIIIKKAETKKLSSLFGAYRGQLAEVRKEMEAARNDW